MNADPEERLHNENKRLHDIIMQQKEQLDNILSSVNEVIWSRRPDFSLAYINNACLKVFGYTPEELLANGGIHFNHVHPDDRDKLAEQIDKTIKTGHGELEYRIFHKDGSVKHIFSQVHLKKDDNGKLVMFNGTSVDVTALRLAEYDIVKKANEIEDIFESITDSFIALDKNFNYTYINKQAEKLYNRKREDLLHKNVWEEYPKAKELKFYPNTLRAMNEQVAVSFEEYSPSANTWLAVNAYPTKDGLAIYFRDITEHRALQEKIFSSEQNLRSVINNTKDIIWSMDKNLTVISANNAYYDRVASITNNKKYEDLTSDDFAQERLDLWRNYFERAFNGETFKAVIEDVVAGKTVFEEISFNPFRDQDNNIVGVSCFSRDITEQQKLQEKIITDEDNLRALINNTSDFIWSVDADLNIISINEPYRDYLYSFTKKNIKAGSSVILDEYSAEIKEKWKAHYKKALSGKRTIITDEEIIYNDTQFREIRLHPIIDKNGKIAGVSCFASNITEETKLREKIQKDEQNLRATINNTSDSIWSIDRDMNIILINDAYKDFVYKYTGIVATQGTYALWKGLSKEFLAEREKDYKRALAGESFSVINSITLGNATLYADTNFNPVKDAKGNVLGVNCFSRDITENRRHMLQIEEQNERLKEIAWIQLHKVRGPVANILGLVKVFNDKDPSDPDNKKIIEGIKSVADELDKIIHEIVDKTSIIS